MFGLMKFVRCASTEQDRARHQQQYCGVCKAIGSLYGQAARLLLNRDLVFFSELLTELSATPMRWNLPARRRNCLPLPNAEDVPPSFRIAANYTLVMTRFQLDDHLADSRGISSVKWRAASALFAPACRKAIWQAEEWGYPLRDVGWWMREQIRREAVISSRATPSERLRFAAEPSAVTTGMSMRHAAEMIGQAAHAAPMFRLGYAFGQVIYLLDALEDFEDDARRGQFNAIRAAYQLSDAALPATVRRETHRKIAESEEAARQALSELPLSRHLIAHFGTRLTRNVARAACMTLDGDGLFACASSINGAEQPQLKRKRFGGWLNWCDCCDICDCLPDSCSGCESCGDGCHDCGHCDCGDCDCGGCDCN